MSWIRSKSPESLSLYPPQRWPSVSAWLSVVVCGSLPLLWFLCSEWEGGFLGEVIQDRITGPFQNQLLEGLQSTN